MLEVLRKVVQQVNAAKSLEQAMQELVTCVKTEMKTQVCSIYLLNKEKTRYILMATDGLNPDSVGKVSMSLEEGLVGLVAHRAEPINLLDAETHPSYRYFPETGEELFHSFLGSPIIHHGRVLGVLVVQQRESRRFEEQEEALVITLSAQLAGVIAHAEVTGALTRIVKSGVEEGDVSGDRTFEGISVCSGIAIGVARVMRAREDLASVPVLYCDDVEKEMSRFHNALIKVRSEIQRLGQQLTDRLNEEERALFDVYLRMLADNAIGGEVVSRIVAEKYQATTAVSEVILEHVATFDAMEDAYLRERSIDVKDLGLRVLAALNEEESATTPYPDKTILVGDEITASMLGDVPEEKLAGIISIHGSQTSHMSILARAMGIPTIIGANELPYQKLDQQQIIVDAFIGKIHTLPTKQLKREYRELLREEEKLSEFFEEIRDLAAETKDGKSIRLQANTGLMTDIARSLSRGAEGVGLYRTEISFLMRDRFPSEEEQRVIYREQLEAFHPRTVTMRTLDIGGDKALPYFPIKEQNPYLGWRGIRVSLDHPDIFLVQVRGMLKASEGLGNLRILLPMVACITELEQAMKLIHRAYRELIEENYNVDLPQIGVMIEVPAVMYQIKEFARRVDFLSVGSNDLTQYLLAVDRNNPRVAKLYDSFHPAVMRALNWIVGECRKEGKRVSICGEIAGDPLAAVMLMAMGYDHLSMNANSLPRVKAVIRESKLSDLQRLLEEVLKMEDSLSVKEYLRSALLENGVSATLIH